MLADITLSDTQFYATITGLCAVIGVLFWQLIASKDRQLEAHRLAYDVEHTELENLRKSWEDIAIDAVKTATKTSNELRARDGLSLIKALAPVVSEHSSPPTFNQQQDALIATNRAVLESIKLIEGQAPREEPPPLTIMKIETNVTGRSR